MTIKMILIAQYYRRGRQPLPGRTSDFQLGIRVLNFKSRCSQESPLMKVNRRSFRTVVCILLLIW